VLRLEVLCPANRLGRSWHPQAVEQSGRRARSLPQAVCGVAAGTTPHHTTPRSSSCRCASQPSHVACIDRCYDAEELTTKRMQVQTIHQPVHVQSSHTLTSSPGYSSHIERYNQRCASLLNSYVKAMKMGSSHLAIEQTQASEPASPQSDG
jgi:hypothetical protein